MDERERCGDCRWWRRNHTNRSNGFCTVNPRTPLWRGDVGAIVGALPIMGEEESCHLWNAPTEGAEEWEYSEGDRRGEPD